MDIPISHVKGSLHSAEICFCDGDLCEAFLKSHGALSLLRYLDGDDRISSDAQIQIKSLLQRAEGLLAQVETHPDWKQYHAGRMERLGRQAKEEIRLMVDGFNASAEAAMRGDSTANLPIP